jgi:hypothetical protein
MTDMVPWLFTVDYYTQLSMRKLSTSYLYKFRYTLTSEHLDVIHLEATHDDEQWKACNAAIASALLLEACRVTSAQHVTQHLRVHSFKMFQ